MRHGPGASVTAAVGDPTPPTTCAPVSSSPSTGRLPFTREVSQARGVAEVPASARIKRIVALARPEARRLALGTFFLAVSSASMLAYPQAIRVILDEALGKRDLDALNQIAVAVLVVMLLQAVTSAARFYLFTTAGERVVTQLRRTLYERLVRQEIASSTAAPRASS